MASKQRDIQFISQNNKHLEFTLKKSWTAEEDATLLQLRHRRPQQPPRSWKEISDLLPARSPDACQLRYARLRKKEEQDPSDEQKMQGVVDTYTSGYPTQDADQAHKARHVDASGVPTQDADRTQHTNQGHPVQDANSTTPSLLSAQTIVWQLSPPTPDPLSSQNMDRLSVLPLEPWERRPAQKKWSHHPSTEERWQPDPTQAQGQLYPTQVQGQLYPTQDKGQLYPTQGKGQLNPPTEGTWLLSPPAERQRTAHPSIHPPNQNLPFMNPPMESRPLLSPPKETPPLIYVPQPQAPLPSLPSCQHLFDSVIAYHWMRGRKENGDPLPLAK